MKKRVFILALAMMLLISCLLSSCSTVDEQSTEANLVDTTGYACIKVYGVKDEGTTDEAIAAVEDSINKITLKEFKTKIKFMLFEEDKYLDAIEEAKAGLKKLEAAAKKAKSDARIESKRLSKLKNEDYEAYRKEMVAKQNAAKKAAAEKKAKEEQMQKEAEAAGVEYIPEIEIPEYAVDVLLVRDLDELKAFKKDAMLKALSEYVTLDYKDISKFIHPTLLDMGRINGTLYGVVNNTYAGESQYVVFDTEIYEKYKDQLTTINGLSSLRPFLEEVRDNEEGIIPLLNTPDVAPNGDLINGAKNPIGVYNPDNNSITEFSIVNLFTNNEYESYFNYINTFRYNGILPAPGATVSENDKWAVKFISGDEYLKRDLEEQGYTVLTFTKPRITDENCKLSYYGVYSDTSYPTRAMEFIQMLTTNAEVQTLFAYGIEGVNYELTEDGKVHKLNNTYNINSAYAGNRFVGIPSEEENADIFEVAKERNQNAKVSAFYGTKFDYSKDYIIDYTKEKVEDNIKSAARSANGETFYYFVNGDMTKYDQYAIDYRDELETYCRSYEVGGLFMVSPYQSDFDGFYVGSTVRSKISGIPTDIKEKVKASIFDPELLALMKEASASTDDKVYSILVEDPDNSDLTTHYAVYPIIYAVPGTSEDEKAQDTVVGLVCSITQTEDTMQKVESILAEYWGDLSSGIPNSSIDRFADRVAEEEEDLNRRIKSAKNNLANAKDAEAKASANSILKSLPSSTDVIVDLLVDLGDNEKLKRDYASKISKCYASYASGKTSHAAYVKSVRNIIEKDFYKIWNVWDEISHMNERMSNETNLKSLLEILNKQYGN